MNLPELKLGPVSHLHHWSKLKSDHPAIIGPNATISYQELLAMVIEGADALTRSGVIPGEGVVIQAESELERVLTLAVIQAGAIATSQNKMIDASRFRQLGFGFSVGLGPELDSLGLKRVALPASFGRKQAGKSPREVRVPEPTDTLRVVFSSGTTGEPKGVPFSAEVLQARVASASKHYMSVSPYLTTVGFGSVSGNTSFFLDLWRGHTHLVPGGAGHNLDLIQTHRVQGIMGSPSTLDSLAREATLRNSTITVPRVFCAGSFLSRKLEEGLGSIFNCEVTNIYGSTEAGLVAWSDSSTPAGLLQTFLGVEVLIVEDRSSRREVEQGLIAIKSPYLAGPYLGMATESQDAFVDDYFFSGDVGRISGRFLQLEGRDDDLINLKGEKINPIPIETYVIENFDIAEAACILATTKDGQAYHLMLAVCSADIDLEGVKRQLITVFRTSAPQRVMRVSKLARNEMGKILRKTLVHLTGKEDSIG